MGYSGKLDEKYKAQTLRKNGRSYAEILRTVHVSKDTMSRWCRDIELSNRQKDILAKRKIFGQKKGSLIAAENKRKIRLSAIESFYKNGQKDIAVISKRDKFIIGVALYAGEGTKTDGQGAFSNSNPQLIKFMIDWFRIYCKVTEEKFRGAIWLHEGLDELKAKQFWSKITGIPESQFFKTYISKNKINSRKIRKNIHSYGVFSIRFSNTPIQRKIIGWISALFDGKMPIVR